LYNQNLLPIQTSSSETVLYGGSVLAKSGRRYSADSIVAFQLCQWWFSHKETS